MSYYDEMMAKLADKIREQNLSREEIEVIRHRHLESAENPPEDFDKHTANCWAVDQYQWAKACETVLDEQPLGRKETYKELNDMRREINCTISLNRARSDANWAKLNETAQLKRHTRDTFLASAAIVFAVWSLSPALLMRLEMAPNAGEAQTAGIWLAVAAAVFSFYNWRRDTTAAAKRADEKIEKADKSVSYWQAKYDDLWDD